jgi:hypothetical protein
MKLLRKFIKEAVKISASPEYMIKEKVRLELQNIISEKVHSGQIQSQDELDTFVNSLAMSLSALKMVPYDAWRKM